MIFLKKMTVKGDQVFFDEPVSGRQVVVEGEAKQRTDFVVAVVRQAVSVRDQDEKDIEQAFVLVQAAPEAIAQEAVLDEGEAAGDLSPAIRTQGLFVNHGVDLLAYDATAQTQASRSSPCLQDRLKHWN